MNTDMVIAVFVLVLGWIAATAVSGVILAAFLARFEVPVEQEAAKGLENGGFWIGVSERSLIYIFIIMGEPSGVGFLVAAKSIFRIGEIRDGEQRKLAEYILIGTLSSFTLAVVVGILARHLLAVIGT